MNNRPRRLVGVLGTHTEVGKTWVLSQLLARARAEGKRVAARKPVQSFAPDDVSTDAARLAYASGDTVEQVCPSHRWYPTPMAPPMAADVLGRERLSVDALVSEISWRESTAIGFIETVGGARSPIAHDGDSIDLIGRAGVDEVLLVADAGLGTINSVRLTLACVPAALPVIVVLNRFDASNELHRRNHEWLKTADRLDVRTNWDQWR